MSTIKTWEELLEERIGDGQITTNDDVRLAMQDHIDALGEGFKVAQEEVEILTSELNGKRQSFAHASNEARSLLAERNALQAQINELREALKGAREERNNLVMQNAGYLLRLKSTEDKRDTLQAKLSAIEAQEPVATVLMHEGEKILDGSMAFMDSTVVGTELYSAPVAPAQPLATEQVHPVKRPINCGTNHCSCIECVMGPAQGEHAELIKDLLKMATNSSFKAEKVLREAAALLQSNAERVPLTTERISELWDAHRIPLFDGKMGINPIVFARAIEDEITKGVRG